MNVATSYPSDLRRRLSISFSSASAFSAGESKMTFPLAMNVSTFESPSDANSLRKRSILTLWPPTLIARRKATNRVVSVDGDPKESLPILPATMVEYTASLCSTRPALALATSPRSSLARNVIEVKPVHQMRPGQQRARKPDKLDALTG